MSLQSRIPGNHHMFYVGKKRFDPSYLVGAYLATIAEERTFETRRIKFNGFSIDGHWNPLTCDCSQWQKKRSTACSTHSHNDFGNAGRILASILCYLHLGHNVCNARICPINSNKKIVNLLTSLHDMLKNIITFKAAGCILWYGSAVRNTFWHV